MWSLSYGMILQDDFSSTDYTISGPKAFFANMPLSKTLTMNLDVPEPWLVEPVIAVYVSSITSCIRTESLCMHLIILTFFFILDLSWYGPVLSDMIWIIFCLRTLETQGRYKLCLNLRLFF